MGKVDGSVVETPSNAVEWSAGIGDNHSSSVFDIQPPTVETEGTLGGRWDSESAQPCSGW